ncbi:hypothetical protein ACWCXX_34925 [Streptomyces sp. NPDC001732]
MLHGAVLAAQSIATLIAAHGVLLTPLGWSWIVAPGDHVTDFGSSG